MCTSIGLSLRFYSGLYINYPEFRRYHHNIEKISIATLKINYPQRTRPGAVARPFAITVVAGGLEIDPHVRQLLP